MLIRIALIVAILAGLAAGGLNFVKVKEKVTKLQADLKEQTDGRIKAETELASTKKDLAKTKTELTQTKTALESTTTELASAKSNLEKTTTDLDNTTLLCGFHHREHGKRGWTVRLVDGIPEWTPPRWIDPQLIPRRNHHPPLHFPAPIQTQRNRTQTDDAPHEPILACA